MFWIATIFQQSFNSSALDRFVNVFNFDSTFSQSTLVRLLAYQSSWNLFIEYPIIGSTIIDPATGFYPHNISLEILISSGLIGGVCFLMLLILTYLGALKIYRYRYDMFWIVLLLIQQFLLSQTSGAVWGASTFWVLLAAVILANQVIETPGRR